MLDNLINLVREQAGSAIINNPTVPNERNEEVISATGQSIAGGLQNMLASGGLKDVLKLFGGQDAASNNNPVVQNLSGNVVQQLMNQFGFDQQSAGGIAGNLVPNVLQNLVSKTNDPNDNSFDIQGIFNHLSGGKSQGFNIQGLLGKVTQGGLDKDGDTDLQDVMAMFSGGQAGGGNLLDSVKGFFSR
ncbi:hypothetical protein [Paraflavitalea sp. CAU 1676]|uniref:hypothetical protein n=1 Tax=Paraflavitalea sp. CAU 1676 TaxID=3032598 RepID=UPI0023D9EDC6|nr:hypothetical protein [Paraflavitalea sp. CAU 1676]MDF2187130.1 hypothetical protein [Paraflavitalea sp. CAU 1676]